MRCQAVVIAAIHLLAFHASVTGALAEESVQLNLVLALDASASVNDEEFQLQRTGTAQAFRDPDVQAALSRIPGGIYVCIVQWSSIKQQAVGIDWSHVSDASGADRMANMVEKMPRKLAGGNTMIHAGLVFAGSMLESAPASAEREVVDLSGNGKADDLPLLETERRRLVADGIVINGLAIEEDPGNITQHFRDHLIGGPGAFVITANSFDDFARAMRLKLLREFGQQDVALQ